MGYKKIFLVLLLFATLSAVFAQKMLSGNIGNPTPADINSINKLAVQGFNYDVAEPGSGYLKLKIPRAGTYELSIIIQGAPDKDEGLDFYLYDDRSMPGDPLVWADDSILSEYVKRLSFSDAQDYYLALENWSDDPIAFNFTLEEVVTTELYPWLEVVKASKDLRSPTKLKFDQDYLIFFEPYPNDDDDPYNSHYFTVEFPHEGTYIVY